MRLKVLIALLGLLMPVAALAESPSYNYVEAGWVDIDADGDSESGWAAGGMFEVKAIEIFGEYTDVDGVSITDVGLGWAGGLGEEADFVVQAAWLDLDLDSGSDEDGYRVSGGARWRASELIEINGFVNYWDLDSDSETFLEGNILFHFGEFAVGVGYEANDIDIARAYVRWNFK